MKKKRRRYRRIILSQKEIAEEILVKNPPGFSCEIYDRYED